MFSLAIFCLTTSNLPWFMALNFQVPMQYCSLQQWPLLSPSDTYTTGYHFHFGSVLSFFLELLVIALCSSQVAYSILETLWLWWVLIYLWHIFLPFHTVHGFSREEYWSELSFPTPVDHVLGELFTMTHLSWVILHCKAYRLIGLCKSLHHDNTVIYEGVIKRTSMYICGSDWII